MKCNLRELLVISETPCLFQVKISYPLPATQGKKCRFHFEKGSGKIVLFAKFSQYMLELVTFAEF